MDELKVKMTAILRAVDEGAQNIRIIDSKTHEFIVLSSEEATRFSKNVLELLESKVCCTSNPRIRKQDYVWHVIKSTSKYGKTVYRIRRALWESYVIYVLTNGGDEWYFPTWKEAETARQKIKNKDGERT